MSDPSSITAAAQTIKAKLRNNKLYGLVNNAGVMYMVSQITKEEMIKTNVYGVKLMTEAFIPLLNPTKGRIVNMGSAAGPNYVSSIESTEQGAFKKLSSHPVTWPELVFHMKTTEADGLMSYGMTKAVLHKYTELCAIKHPNLQINAVTPGFVDTNMTANTPSFMAKALGTKATPEEGCKSTMHAMFSDLDGNGLYYGSDCVRSPLHTMRSPGDPAFMGYPKL